jgi:hypothetical protein
MKRMFLLIALILSVTSIAQSQHRYDPNAIDKGHCNCCVSGDPECGAIDNRRIQVKVPAAFDESDKPSAAIRTARPKITSFQAELSIDNATPNTIKQITWECSFVEPSTMKELGRCFSGRNQSFTLVSKKRIAPHTSTTLREVVLFTFPQDFRGKAMQAMQVNRVKEILYTDGSVRTF